MRNQSILLDNPEPFAIDISPPSGGAAALSQFSFCLACGKEQIMNCRRIVGALVIALAWPFGASAQVATATVQGRVLDPSGTPVPGATVSARNTDTGATRTTTSDTSGTYRIAALSVGP